MLTLYFLLNRFCKKVQQTKGMFFRPCVRCTFVYLLRLSDLLFVQKLAASFLLPFAVQLVQIIAYR